MIGLALSTGIHVLTLFEVNVAAWSRSVYLLHIGIFFVFIPFIFDLRRVHLGGWGHLFSAIPAWAYLAIIAAFTYASVNFRQTVGASGHGVWSATDFRGLRAFSGLWLVFYLIPAVYFRWAPRVLSPEGRDAA
jgi:hypothetical protein